MPLFQERLRQQEKAERLGRGESIPMKTSIHRESRTRIYWAMEEHSQAWSSMVVRFRQLMMSEWGSTYLEHPGNGPYLDVKHFLTMDSGVTPGQTLDMIEGWIAVARSQRYPETFIDRFRKSVNRIFDENDLAYQVIGDEVKPRDSMAMHANVVAPALSLLHGSSALAGVEKAFQDALGELKPDGDPADAITDAATALQEMFVALGCQGNSLGPLIKDARKRGYLGPHDSKLVQGVERIADWVSAHRSSRGDAHVVTDATRSEAWLAVHVAGALILHLEQQIAP